VSGPRRTGLIVAAITLVAVVAAPRFVREMPDLEVYWKTAVRARAAEPLYRAADQHYQFKYLPAFAVLSMPLGMLPLPVAKAVWLHASLSSMVVLVALSLALPAERRKPAWLLATATLVVMAKFYGHEWILGQVNLLFAVLVVLALHAMRRGAEPAAGALLVLAIVVKPYAVIFLPWLLARGRRASIATAAAGLMAVLALPALVYGATGAIELHRAWWHTVTESTAPNLLNADNVSIAAMYAKWMGVGRASALLAAVTGVLVACAAAVVFLRRRHVTFPEGLEGALLLTCIPLISPQGWDYVFLVSTPAIVYLVNHEDQLPPGMRGSALAALAVIAFSIYDVMGRAAYGTFMALSLLTVCYGVVVAALCRLRLRGAA
jgi:hypothetical protein